MASKQISAGTSSQSTSEPVFTPSSTDLCDMIRRAEAKFAADRNRCFSERAERARAINAQLTRAKRLNNARRYRRAGDMP
jgi:hypothetical protein